ncbi:MAG: hypothetical protein R6V20_06970 [Desulfobia sp.]
MELQIKPRPRVKGRIDIVDLDLEGFKGFVEGALDIMSGRFSAGGGFTLGLGPENRPDFFL